MLNIWQRVQYMAATQTAVTHGCYPSLQYTGSFNAWLLNTITVHSFSKWPHYMAKLYGYATLLYYCRQQYNNAVQYKATMLRFMTTIHGNNTWLYHIPTLLGYNALLLGSNAWLPSWPQYCMWLQYMYVTLVFKHGYYISRLQYMASIPIGVWLREGGASSKVSKSNLKHDSLWYIWPIRTRGDPSTMSVRRPPPCSVLLGGT